MGPKDAQNRERYKHAYHDRELMLVNPVMFPKSNHVKS